MAIDHKRPSRQPKSINDIGVEVAPTTAIITMHAYLTRLNHKTMC